MLSINDREWLNRISRGMVGLILVNQAKQSLDRETLEHLGYILNGDEGALCVWGRPDGLDVVFEVSHHASTDLYVCGRYSVPCIDQSVPLPKRPPGMESPSFPATFSTWAIHALSKPGALVLGIGTIRGQVLEVAGASGRKGLELAVNSQKVIPPPGGWVGHAELTDPECLARFRSAYVVSETGCHIWQRPLDEDGYGRFSARGRQYKAHRFAYSVEFGPLVNPRLPLGHECGNRSCVNPYHLHLEPIHDNTAEAWRDRRARERAARQQ